MKVLIVGSGGRERALAWRLRREAVDVVVTSGNSGTGPAPAGRPNQLDALVDLVRRERIDLTIVGPEAPLAAGFVDRFAAEKLRVFGPTCEAARLEWSKAWTKGFLERHGIPTASAEIVESEAAARRAIARHGLPVVLKADGLAGGKGVFVALTSDDVEQAFDLLFRQATLVDAARQVLIEELLQGPELSVLAFTDGERIAVMPPARDYKRLLDDDRGPNTGGMGGYTRPGYATPGLLEDVEQRILKPTLAGMRAEGHLYRGVLYAGLMLTADGPKVLEFNSRFGDPECQLIVPLLESSLLEICMSVADGEFDPERVAWSAERTYGVVLAAPGYPQAPRVGDPIHGLDDLPADVLAFHAGTLQLDNGSVVTSGGRVVTLVSTQRETVYRAAAAISFPGKQFRRDIGTPAKSRLQPALVVA